MGKIGNCLIGFDNEAFEIAAYTELMQKGETIRSVADCQMVITKDACSQLSVKHTILDENL